MRSALKRAVAVGLALGAIACYPDSAVDENSDFDTVTTIFNQETVFGTIRTFALVDSVVHLTDSSITDLTARQFDQVILDQVRANMQARGYTELAAANLGADVVMLVAATSSVNFGYVSYPFWGYWGWYGGWYPYYGAGWSYYYPTTVVPYSYESGTVLVVMLDQRAQDPVAEQVPVVWSAALNGVLSSESSNQARVVTGIDQAFEQSPYLQAQ